MVRGWIGALFLFGLACSSGCSSHMDGPGRQSGFEASLAGVLVETSGNPVRYDFASTKINRRPLTERVKLESDDSFRTSNSVLHIEASYESRSGDQDFDYDVLLGTDIETSSDAMAEFEESPPVLVSTSGWLFFWGWRPHGQSRLVDAIAIASTLVLKNDAMSTDGADYVFLLEGSRVEIKCLHGSRSTYVIEAPNRYVRVTLAGGECHFEPPSGGKPIDAAVQSFLDRVKAYATAARWP